MVHNKRMFIISGFIISDPDCTKKISKIGVKRESRGLICVNSTQIAERNRTRGHTIGLGQILRMEVFVTFLRS